ncbi:hypothetical protein [Polyangium spumosum]|uniref:Uncharacterized protein n=1 Tax=Polyangium spumosum TaxID=889282 RepID=A0A6N7Q0W0_9BACT|nr:hypothetical protein [Polyangium spumosum]MRG97913.1 hypothetical protein [Polyangium spumosum]
MNVSLQALFPGIYVFTPGRRVLSMRQVRAEAVTAGFLGLVTHADVCVAQDREALVIEARWNGRAQGSPVIPGLRELDITLDGTMTSFRDTIDRQVRVSKADDPLAASGASLLQILFPLGAAAVTNAKYPDQAAEVDRILDEVKQPKWAPVVAEFGLTRMITHITELATEYRKLLETPAADGLKYETVKEERAKGQNLMLQALAMILGKYPSESDADRAGREALMGPILRQNDAIGQYLKARRSVPDVNPETGEELLSSDAETSART